MTLAAWLAAVWPLLTRDESRALYRALGSAGDPSDVQLDRGRSWFSEWFS